jgi:hypothetical protein
MLANIVGEDKRKPNKPTIVINLARSESMAKLP